MFFENLELRGSCGVHEYMWHILVAGSDLPESAVIMEGGVSALVELVC